MIDSASEGVPADIPCTQELSNAFDCPYEFINSIGWAVRNDFNTFGENLHEYGASETEKKFQLHQAEITSIAKPHGR